MVKICSVLVVDGHEGVRQLLGEALEAEGYRFVLTANGAGMRRALEEEPYDVAMIDVSMRGEDGFALAEEAERKGLSVILTTADRSKRDAIERTGRPHLLKPYRMPHLLEMIRSTLESAEAECVRRKPAPH
jgi:two-component system OmpR family response regulator